MFEDILKPREIKIMKCCCRIAGGQCGYPMEIDKNINNQFITCPSCGGGHHFINCSTVLSIVSKDCKKILTTRSDITIAIEEVEKYLEELTG